MSDPISRLNAALKHRCEMGALDRGKRGGDRLSHEGPGAQPPRPTEGRRQILPPVLDGEMPRDRLDPERQLRVEEATGIALAMGTAGGNSSAGERTHGQSSRGSRTIDLHEQLATRGARDPRAQS